MTEDAESEAVKGMILDAWIEDLGSDRSPRTIPEMGTLTPEELEELMQLARWYKASFFASQSVQTDVDSMAATLRERVYEDRASELELVAMLTGNAITFGSALQAARARLGVEPEVLEQAHALPRGVVSQLEAGKLPPHRVAIDKMVVLLQGLRFSQQVLDLIRRSCIEWAASAYGQAQTQLGRIDRSLNNVERLRLLQDAAGEADEGLSKELDQIREYCNTLEARLP
ncbi:MAG: hypothetical protein A2148_08550 [Chloroflexi bacterium RBG_16_68_14]|nr:MAG: hypothetical protein A2148_08550 [Chloroflexi bacterium RBG_16_68_14]